MAGPTGAETHPFAVTAVGFVETSLISTGVYLTVVWWSPIICIGTTSINQGWVLRKWKHGFGWSGEGFGREKNRRCLFGHCAVKVEAPFYEGCTPPDFKAKHAFLNVGPDVWLPTG